MKLSVMAPSFSGLGGFFLNDSAMCFYLLG